MRYPMRFWSSLFLIAMMTGITAAQDAVVRIMDYNLLNYNTNSNDRNPDYSMILEGIQPDIILTQEVTNSSSATDFLNEVLDPQLWDRSPAAAFGSSEEYAFYRRDRLELLSTVSIPTELRNHQLFEFQSLLIPSNPTFRISTTHLKASLGEEQRRYDEVISFYNYMVSHNLFDTDLLFTGDLNLYTNTEPAYQALLGDCGFMDPISRPGSWHDNINFADIHTQSPRTQSFGGGATGGMDDRFDFILVQPPLMDEEEWGVSPQTYTAFGNDGNHFNTAINNGFNAVVSPEMADAIHNASDHVPVFMDLGYWLAGTQIILTLEPAVPDPIILPGGGILEFTAYLTNATNQMLTRDAWTYVILPNGNSYGPLINASDLHLPANQTITRTLFQEIPAAAPGGTYSYVAKAGNFPGVTQATDQFSFQKLGGAGDMAAFEQYLKGSSGFSGLTGEMLPADFELTRIYPNPFNETAIVELKLPEAQRITITAHDLTGRLVSTLADGNIGAGAQQLTLDLHGQASGLYFVTARSGGVSHTIKAMLVR